jgi:hypothetical protein
VLFLAGVVVVYQQEALGQIERNDLMIAFGANGYQSRK